ncbi:rRNA biogenesis protein RRP5 [Senna tora]|uniref:rRNA biogenesis protein RRP5 n=1 Tax=Senna tora TaxID=362788 RepID=A0A834SNR7_9FABA|nr:rRNA biogenesis protein RRP5 [Senna tora]
MAPHSKKFQKKKSNDRSKVDKSSKKIFKEKKEPHKSSKSEALALQLEDDVPDFPRGGESSLRLRQNGETHAEEDYADFGADDHLKKKKKRNNMLRKSHTPADDEGLLSGAGITGKLQRYANKITLKNISPGMKLWGIVAEVNNKDIVVSLPGGLRGLVHASDAFDPIFNDKIEVGESFLSGVFCVGQLVSCIVLRLDNDNKEKGKRKIWLSLRLSLLHKNFSFDVVQEGMVLSAYVKSIEDHGYILHFGLPSFMGFLPKDSEADSRGDGVKTGQLLQGVVRSIDKVRKVLHMSTDPDMVSKCVTKDLKGISIDLLVPGMMVNARVKSILENGVMLSFLTYFTGTVDLFHLQNIYPTTKWKDDYSESQKVIARILFIDPSSRAVGLTLNPHLVQNKAPPFHAKTGDIYDDSKVVRVDRGFGLLLEVPSIPESTPAYVSISDIAEEEIQKLQKKYREGNRVRVRILGLRHLEGLATGVLKASAFEGDVFTHSDVKPGMVVKAKILSVDAFGAIVQIPGGLKALCPLRHMSEFEIAKPRKKFKEGAEMVFRVLGCKSKRITVTHKKTLVKSKLGIISSYADATDGLITHGWIAKIEMHGCFVEFYFSDGNGFISSEESFTVALLFDYEVLAFVVGSILKCRKLCLSELGLEPGGDPGSVYNVEQVVKCRVISSIPASRRINLSFIIKPTRASEDDMVKLGSLVSGVVDRVTSNAIVVCVNARGFSRGKISVEHLADHHGQATLMKSVLKPGYNFDQLLVLDIEGNNNLVLSAKSSLIKFAEQIPSDISQIHPNSVVHGYICNLIETGCFVRFLGRLTGFSPRKKATDDQKTNLLEAYYIGQSVRSNVFEISSETGKITLSLKQTSCSSTDASFIQDYFLIEEKIAKLQYLGSSGSDLNWIEGFNIGTVVNGKVDDVKEVGVVISFEKYNDVFGFITNYQLAGTTLERGSVVKALVLDVAKAEHLVDLSLRPEFINGSEEGGSTSHANKKKRRREASRNLVTHQTVNAVVEIVKENYLASVLSIPDHNYAIGYASLSDYNTQRFPQKQFLNGQRSGLIFKMVYLVSVIATVMALPSSETAGRLLLLLTEVTEASSSKRAKKKSSYKVGSLVQAEITEIKPLELKLKFGTGLHGRIHITEVHDIDVLENPFASYKIGQTVTARIVAKPNESESHRKGSQWELSVRPRMLAGSSDIGDNISESFEFSTGQCVTGYVYKVDSEWVRLTISRNVRAQLYILDSACEPNELDDFQNRFYVGKPISGYILSINTEKKLLRLVLHPFSALRHTVGDDAVVKLDGQQTNNVNDDRTAYIHEGDILGGRISKILPGVGGLFVQVGPRTYGRVHFTELTDTWVPDPLSGYHVGQFVKCVVLEVSHSVKGTVHVDLSFRSSDGMPSQNSKEVRNIVSTNIKCVEKIEDLHPDMVVQGYVKNVSPKGCFIFLSRKIDAMIRLSNLSDDYVNDPEKEYPVGMLVTGRVLSVEPLSNRVEVTLKKSNGTSRTKSEITDLSNLHVGDVISGRVKRVESYGLFIAIDNTNVVGLCHISEISDDHIDDIDTKFRAGEKVNAKILKVDEERQRISLGMKNSYLNDEPALEVSLEQESDKSFADELKSLASMTRNFLDAEIMKIEGENEQCPTFLQAEARSSIPPLDVTIDDFDQCEINNSNSQNEEHANQETIDEKQKRRARKKEKEEREKEIRAAEERLLEEDIPRTADEFEKMVRSSPNSSFIWIKYMDFMISMADVEKARAIAESICTRSETCNYLLGEKIRHDFTLYWALRTINIREENEKLNIWKAYFNLENKFGNPREEAVMKVFQRALQYNDSKKVHLALLGMYERTEQYDLADELVNKMTKKFKHSCKVWLRLVQRLLKQNQDGIHSAVSRALLSLLRHKHIKFISQTAILEFKAGVPDRGRSLFEGILREYPKRTDLWSVYLDQEIQLKDSDVIRALFERAISLSLPPKKMKFLFKKYLGYEKSQGDEERIEYVKKKAMEYVESSLA